MSFVKILDVNVQFLKAATGKDFMDEVSRDIERKLDHIGDTPGSSYSRLDIVQLIGSIEAAKFRYLQGTITAKQLYRDVAVQLDRFKMQHPGFDYLNDSVLNTYFS
jgi:hypothetical protein